MIPRYNHITGSVTILILLILCAACTNPQEPAGTKSLSPVISGSTQVTEPVTEPDFLPATGIPATPLLGRPTDHSVNINILPSADLTVHVEYHNSSMTGPARTNSVEARNGIPVNIVPDTLAPDTAYSYRVCWQELGSTGSGCSPEYSFHTQRAKGDTFVFDIQADSHLDDKAIGDLYNRTLSHERAEQPDFLIDLGDTSMTEKLSDKSETSIRSRYLLQRAYLGTAGSSVPIFLVLGNHDGESGYALSGKDKTLALLSLHFRQTYFPNPVPDAFYSGNAGNEPDTGLRQDYYAWQWGDALFIVIDPFWYTTTKPGGSTDGWGWTLGKDQYQWLEETLNRDTAKYTFVFSHHLVGGDAQGRGGTEYASLYEWGGNNTDGTYGFSQHRPGWDMPVRQVLATHNVTAFFHGHDHLFAYQQLDGITYQDVPQPATPGTQNPGAEYGYTHGIILPSPGHLRITVSPESANVEYIGSAIQGMNRNTPADGSVVYTYTLQPR